MTTEPSVTTPEPAAAVASASGSDRIPSIVHALISVTPAPALEEVERALRGRFRGVDKARVRRLRELRLLSVLLAENEHLLLGGDAPYVPSDVYDIERRARAQAGDAAATEAPTSSKLRTRFGSWMRACAAAASIDDDGCFVGARQPWPHGTIGRRGASIPYTRDEVCQAIRDCAFAIKRVPSSAQYTEWRQGHVARLRAQGITPRIPAIGCIYRLLAPKPTLRTGWRTALSSAFPELDEVTLDQPAALRGLTSEWD